MDTTDPTTAEAPSGRPVFVDASGRRSTWVRRGGRIVSTLLVGYLLIVIAALVGPSQLSRLTLPGVGPLLPGPEAATLTDGAGDDTREGPQAVLEATSPPASRRSSPRPSPSATSRVTSAPTPAGPAATTTPPGRAGTAPGRRPRSAAPTATTVATTTPSATPSPTSPRNSRAPSPRPKPSRSPR